MRAIADMDDMQAALAAVAILVNSDANPRKAGRRAFLRAAWWRILISANTDPALVAAAALLETVGEPRLPSGGVRPVDPDREALQARLDSRTVADYFAPWEDRMAHEERALVARLAAP